tara:strand:+ start:34 stop:621 length:588 start_codon:yes stop_codon:yes gene_type:complete
LVLHSSVNIHPTSIVEVGAEIGEESNIWHWVHICKGAKIGKRCSFGQNVFVGNDVVIGNNVKVQNNVSIFDKVFLMDNVFCGPSMVFTNVYNPRSKISRKDSFLETIVEEGVTFGANSTIICGNKIGKHAFIGAGTVITKDVKPFALVVGNPGVQIGWMSTYGERINLPISGNGSWSSQITGETYYLKDNKVFNE